VRALPRPKRLARYVLVRATQALLSPVRLALVRHARAQQPAAERGRPDPVLMMLVNAWGMGGTIRVTYNLAGWLASTHDVEILSLVRRREKPFFELPRGVAITALNDERPGAKPPELGFLRPLLTRLPSILIHAADRASAESNLWVDLMLARRLRGQAGFLIGTRPGLNLIAADVSSPSLVAVGQEHMHLHAHPWPLRRAMARKYRKLDGLGVLTEGDRVSYESLLGASTAGVRLMSIPNTVRGISGERADLAAKGVLAAGRLNPQKGFDLLVEAYARVADVHPDWRLRICGKGEQHEELGRLVQARGLESAIALPGPRDLSQEMARSAILVLSSRWEGFPLVLLEAMSYGMAVVAFDCPTGPAELIDDHENGLLVPAGDVGGLGNAILELVEDEELRRRCAAGAVETARSYTMEAIGPRWEGFLAELARARQT
jgi:glycosyltransferase involved in cell wall biosynthesis